MTEDRERNGSGRAGLFRGERATQLRAQAQHLEVTRFHQFAEDALGGTATGEIPGGISKYRRGLKDTLVVPQHAVLRIGPDDLAKDTRSLAIRREHVHDHQASGIRKWQRLQQHRVDERKDGDVRADADGEHPHGHRREPQLLAQGAQRVRKILSKGRHHPRGLRVPRPERRRTHAAAHNACDLTPIPESGGA